MRLCCAVAKALLVLALGLGPAQPHGQAAEATRQHRFNLPAGPAEATLKQFAAQAGRQILFPTDAVAEVQTNAVKGRYTMAEALDLLLTGTPLFVREDQPTGAISIGRLAAANRVVQLPLFVVNESPHAPWRYAEVPGLEVLSRCSDETTRMLLMQNQRLSQLLELMVPARLQVRSDVPALYVLYAAESPPVIARELIAELKKTDKSDWSVRVLPNYRFWDQDSLAIFFILSGADFNKGRLTLTPDYLRYRLEARTPALPAWFVEGVMELYRSVTLEPGDADLTGLAQAAESAVVFWPLTWLSEEETQALKKSPKQKRVAPDLAALFGAHHFDGAAGERWRAQAALFIRWALADASAARREALWQFVERTGSAPAENVFRDCFGLDYTEAARQLDAYLPEAVSEGFKLPLGKSAALPQVALRDATAAEIGRIKGDLERLEISYVDAHYPQLTGLYVDQARRTLRAAYDEGSRDPRLLAVLGLAECEAGDDAAAKPFLEEALAAGVARPRAGYELARIYFQEWRQRNPAGPFTPAEAGRVLKPLAAARRLAPPLAEVYELIAEVWLRSDGRISAKQLAVLDEGIAFFPRRTRLIYSTALLQATQGRNEAALALLERGLTIATDPVERAQFEKLQLAVRDATGTIPRGDN